ncbi:MauE/DoxX family redox-associated membrane protein [Paenibacillus puerhi]|uniref:MauE/DoxX family redox-associated membrane protein n=1 Tax=Paenibacillus puerhi TaxID=2692622 RepID=UPI0038B3AA6B
MMLAFLFLLSFYTKVFNINNFIYEISSYGVLPKRLLLISAVSILIYELVLFILYSFGTFTVIREILGITLMVIFSIVTIKKKIKEKTGACSCFGNMRLLNKFPIIRNLFICGLMLMNLNAPVNYNFQVGILLIIWIVSIVIIIDLYQTIGKFIRVVKFYGSHDN